MNVKEKVLKELENNKGSFVSGGSLATNLNVSRNSVWKAINALKKDGYVIEAKSNKGYQLMEDNDILSTWSISKYLNNDFDIQVFDQVTSTNTLLKEMANDGACEKTVIVANEQTKGKGRTGKSFYSPKNSGVYLSLLLRPDITAQESLFITTCAAVAVCKAIEDICDKKAYIKWVNDIFVDDKKVSGILTEASFNIETNKLDYVVLGIGINIVTPSTGYPEDIANIATSLFHSQADSINKKSILIAHFLDYFWEYYKNFQDKSYVQEYIDRSMLLGKSIVIKQNNNNIKALALDIDENCRLKVKLEDNTEMWLSSGEVSIVV